MIPNPLPPFDLEAAQKSLGDAIVGMVHMSMGGAEAKSRVDADALWKALHSAMLAGTQACAELGRMRTSVAALRDAHRPRPHADPHAAGALCEACSLQGSLVGWPCGPWTATDRILTHGQA